MLKIFLKKFLILNLVLSTIITFNAAPIDDLKEKFFNDTMEFECDNASSEKIESDIISRVNKELLKSNKSITSFTEVPQRTLNAIAHLVVYSKKKMTTWSQPICYSDFFKKAGIENYVIHVAYVQNDGKLNANDMLIYRLSPEEPWKAVDFIGAYKFKNIFMANLYSKADEINKTTLTPSSQVGNFGKINTRVTDTSSLIDKVKSSFKIYLIQQYFNIELTIKLATIKKIVAVYYFDESFNKKDLGLLDQRLNDSLKGLKVEVYFEQRNGTFITMPRGYIYNRWLIVKSNK